MYVEQDLCRTRICHESYHIVSASVRSTPSPVGSLHVALPLGAHHAGPLLGDAVACLEAVAEGSVSVVGALIEDHRGVLLGAGSGGGEGQHAGKHGLSIRTEVFTSAASCSS